jgi:hypothetical protein
MSHFVKGFGNKTQGYPRINLDHVVTLRPRRVDGDEAFACIGADGESLGTIALDDLPEPTVIVPNTAPITLLQWYLNDEDEDDSVAFQRYTVLAWCIKGEDLAEPICCTGLYLRGYPPYCYEQRTGDDVSYLFPMDDVSVPTLDEARAFARATFTKCRQQKAAAAKPTEQSV